MDTTKAPHVNDPDLLERLRLVEGDHYFRDCCEPVDAITGRPAREVYAEWVRRYATAYEPATEEDRAWGAKQCSATASTMITIYGEGGWTRYFVRGDGSVWYSRRHGASRVEKARAAGFPIFE